MWDANVLSSVVEDNRAVSNGDGVSGPKKHKDRDYQMELYEMGKERNLIVCLPTGSGKTWVSLLLTRHYLPFCIRDKKKVIFLANTVQLVEQQAKYFSEHIPSSDSHTHVKYFIGSMNVDDWIKAKWDGELYGAEVLVFSTQIFLDLINKAYIAWNDILLIVFDECHHGVKSHAMALVMDSYKAANRSKSPAELSPRILGLTATIIKGKVDKNVEEAISNMEKTFLSKAVTHHNFEEVLKYSTKASVKIETYEPDNSTAHWPVAAFLEASINEFAELDINKPNHANKVKIMNQQSVGVRPILYKDRTDFMRILKNKLKDVLEIYGTLGPYAARLGAGILLNETETKLRGGALYRSMGRAYRIYHTILCKFITDTEDLYTNKTFHLTPKAELLCRVLQTKHLELAGRNEELCAIVFVQKKLDCQVLHWLLQDVAEFRPEDYGFLRTHFLIRVGSGGGTEWEACRMTMKIQRQIINSFRNKTYNTVFSTAILEEGLDVPSCNLVVRFDRVTTYTSYTQSMGRARNPNAEFIVFSKKEDKGAEDSSLKKYKAFNNDLSNALAKNCLHVGEKDIEFVEREDELEPFCPGGTPDSPRITSHEAISTVHNYCSVLGNNLPASAVALPVAWYWKTECGFQAAVVLPNNALVRGKTLGQVMSTSDGAKRAVFLEVCRKLYEAGALNEKLVPLTGGVDPQILKFFDEVKPTETNNIPKGWVPKKVPTLFQKLLQPYASAFVYEFHIELMEPKGLEKEAVYQYADKSWCTTLWSSTSLNMIPPFKLVSSMGPLKFFLKDITEKAEIRCISITESLLEKFKSFQKSLFFDILKLNLRYAEQKGSAYYIVPMKKSHAGVYQFAFDFLKLDRIRKMEKLNVFMDSVEEDNRVEPEENPDFLACGGYAEGLVIPWHAAVTSAGKLFSVIKVLRDKTPNSEFETAAAPSFAEYFKIKYDINVVRKHQPLLRCYRLRSNLNYLSLREVTSNKKSTAAVFTFIPELVHAFPFPATLYTQAYLIPSILHRITGFMHAMELGASISNMSLDSLQRPSYQSWDRWAHNEVLDDDSEAALLRRDALASTAENGSYSNEENNEFEVKLNSTSLGYIHPFKVTMTQIMQVVAEDERLHGADDKTGMTENKLIPRANADVFKFNWTLPDINSLKLGKVDSHIGFDVSKSPPVYEILQAITLLGAKDRISLERLEVIGDSFLKFAATLFLYGRFPSFGEGQYTTLRSNLVSNKNLKSKGDAKGLGEILSSGFFYPNYAFLPPTYYVKDEYAFPAMTCGVPLDVFNNVTDQNLESMSQDELLEHANNAGFTSAPNRTIFGYSKLREKDVADCVEALIGAYYTTGGQQGALHVMNWLGIHGPDANGNPVPFGNWQFPPHVRENECNASPESVVPFIPYLEQLLEYRFKDKWLAVEAFTHSSYTGNTITPCFQRLEFLGDAVLDFLITNHIYKNSEAKTPGEVTDLRSALVNNVTFASLSVRYQLHKMLLHSCLEIQHSIDVFAEMQEKSEHRVIGQFKLLNEDDVPTAQDVEAPKILGDIFEAVCGAVFLDSGTSLDVTWKVFYRLMKNEIDEFSKCCPKAPTREISERQLAFKFEKSENSSSVLCTIVDGQHGVFRGYGPNKKSAKDAVAKFAQRAFHAKQD